MQLVVVNCGELEDGAEALRIAHGVAAGIPDGVSAVVAADGVDGEGGDGDDLLGACDDGCALGDCGGLGRGVGDGVGDGCGICCGCGCEDGQGYLLEEELVSNELCACVGRVTSDLL